MDKAKQAFLAESTELLEEMESSLLRLESNPSDAGALNSVFRAAHTIKGSSGLVGLDNVQDFTHVLENLLEKVRSGQLGITSDLIGLFLECRDHISSLISETLRNKPAEYTRAEGRILLDKLNERLGAEAAPRPRAREAEPLDEGQGPAAATDNWHLSLRFGPEVLRSGMDPISFLNYLARLGELISLTTLFDSLPPAGEMDPETCYLGFEIDFRSDFDKKTIEDVFEFVKEDCEIRILPPRSRIESYIKLIEGLPEETLRLGEILVKGGALTESELREALNLQKKEDAGTRSIGEILVGEGMVHPNVLDTAVEKQKDMESRAFEVRTVRVDTEKLDQMINLVGEMVIAGANIDQLAKRINDREMQQSVSVMSRLIEEMRERAMTVRMMPLHDTFNLFNRVVRDICRDTGKDIELVITGGETELDKTVIEKIKDPMMHLVRNAADHGIEMPGERAALGKPGKGTLTLNAYQDTGDVVIEVSDDGRGLSRERILERAVKLGMAKPSETLSDEETMRLVFMPSFSTASEVTNISGRGVGMDVVRSNIEALRGSVQMESEEGKGVMVRIRLPLTLAIIDGFMVEVASSRYVVPMDAVVECLELSEERKRATHGRDFVNLRGQVLPYISLREVFSLNDSRAPEFEHILVVSHSGREVGLLVDSLHGEIQAVIKSLGRLYRDIRGVSAATILGDGTVALILDVPKLVELALERE